ncbi:hypothetical protein RND81_06G177300 [Saponaria officinalis]|uniref:Uncharacterized protein n=1 Tax=Saponaria officinalis TaxID=3572 RepID=A0AAW1KCK2_SAPOF
MDEQGGVRISGIRQIVRLKEILQKWQNASISSRPNTSNVQHSQSRGISPSVHQRLRASMSIWDSDEEGCQSPEPPSDVPRGFLAVYVGKELPRRRFIIPTAYLSHHLFKLLLEKAEEEFGFDHSGGLTIPCEVETFKYLLNCIETENQVKDDHSDDTEKDSAEESSCPED